MDKVIKKLTLRKTISQQRLQALIQTRTPYTVYSSFFPVYMNFFMYLRAIFCTFQISVDFYIVPVGGRGGGRGGLEKGRGLERGG